MCRAGLREKKSCDSGSLHPKQGPFLSQVPSCQGLLQGELASLLHLSH